MPHKLLKTGELSFRTHRLVQTKLFLQHVILKNQGHLSTERSENNGNNPSETLITRVPSERFNTLVSQIGQHAETFDIKNTKVNDVSEEFKKGPVAGKYFMRIVSKYQKNSIFVI